MVRRKPAGHTDVCDKTSVVPSAHSHILRRQSAEALQRMNAKPKVLRYARLVPLSLVIATCAIVNACAEQPIPTDISQVPGFWIGLVHGFLALFSLLGEVFTKHRIYASPNSGSLYDLGFVIGTAVFFRGSRTVAASSDNVDAQAVGHQVLIGKYVKLAGPMRFGPIEFHYLNLLRKLKRKGKRAANQCD